MQQPMLDSPELAAKQFCGDLADGQEVDSVFVVRELSRRQKRNGDPFLKLRLGDVTGSVEAVCWDGVEECGAHAEVGAVVRVAGRFSVDQRYGATLTLSGLRPADAGEYDPGELVECSPRPFEQMERDLRQLVETIQQPHLRELLARLIGKGTPTGAHYREAPAAKHYHQAYRHGLLEHCLTVAQGVHAMAAGPFTEVDHDVAVTGALLHDIGKLEAYAEMNGSIELTDAGKLQGEIPLGYFRVRSEIESIEGFPPDLAQSVLHILLAHHGKLEHGSPVVPCTREATLVHFVDNLGGTLGSFDRLERALLDGERWSGFDRGISGSAYFAAREAEAKREAA